MPNRPTVALDLDGVLAKYEGWKGHDYFGDPLPGAVQFTRDLAKVARIVVFTCRTTQDNPTGEYGGVSPERMVTVVRSWLMRHGFVFDTIYVGQGKPHAAAYIDDRAVPCRPMDDGPSAYRHTLSRVESLCHKAT